MIFFHNDNSTHQIKIKPFSNEISFLKVFILFKRSLNKIYRYRGNYKIIPGDEFDF